MIWPILPPRASASGRIRRAGVERENRLERPGQRGGGGRVSRGHPQRDRVEQDVDRARRRRSGRCRARGLGRLPDLGMPMSLAHIAATRASRCAARAIPASACCRRRAALSSSRPRVVAAALVKGDLPAQQLHLRGLLRVERVGLDGGQQAQRRVQRAGVAFRPRRREQPLRPARRIRGQQRRAFHERGGRRQAPAGLRAPGRALQLAGDLLIGAWRGLGPVPGAAVGIEPRIGDLRQHAVHLSPVLHGRRPVGRRAHQGMPEPYPRAEFGQLGLDRGRACLHRDAEPPGRPPHQRHVAGRIRRGQLQEPQRLGRQGLQPPQEALLDPPG